MRPEDCGDADNGAPITHEVASASGSLAGAPGVSSRRGQPPICIGFAADWTEPKELTWSGIPYRLREALPAHARVVDVGPMVNPRVERLVRRALHVRYPERTFSTLRWEWPWEDLRARSLGREIRRKGPTSILEVGDTWRVEVPYFPYVDLTFAALEQYERSVILGAVPMSVVHRRARMQEEVFREADAIFVFSRWIAAHIHDDYRIPKDRIHVVGAGISSRAPKPGAGGRSRIGFIGRDFDRKGGWQTVRAVEILRSRGADVGLTVVGPTRVPSLPAWVDFRGRVDYSEVGRVLSETDLFVQPSRFEPFGVAFVEALSAGVPCIAMDRCAMPEIVHDGENGALVHSEDPGELAGAIERVLGDDGIYEVTMRQAPEVGSRFSWETVAGKMVEVMGNRSSP